MLAFLKRLTKALLISCIWIHTAATGEDARSAALSLGGIQLLADEPSYLSFQVGAFDFSDDDRTAVAYTEFRYGKKLFFIGPVIGIMANTQGGVFGYGGVYADIKYGNWVATPSVTAGGYRQGGSKDLGGIFQFRSSFTLAYQFDRGARLGVRLAHISNAHIYDNNPGENEVLLTYAISF